MQACVAPLNVLYVDCRCGVDTEQSKLQARFVEWPGLTIRLDMWLICLSTADREPVERTEMGVSPIHASLK